MGCTSASSYVGLLVGPDFQDSLEKWKFTTWIDTSVAAEDNTTLDSISLGKKGSTQKEEPKKGLDL